MVLLVVNLKFVFSFGLFAVFITECYLNLGCVGK